MTIYYNNKKITKKAAYEKFGKELVDRRIAEAREAFAEDPNELISWMDGMRIEF